MIAHPLARAALVLAGFAGGALSGFFLAGPAVLADGGGTERAWTVLSAIAVWMLLAAAVGWLAGSPRAAASIAAGALPVLALLVLAEPGAWPVAATLLSGIAGSIAAGAFAGRVAHTRRSRT